MAISRFGDRCFLQVFICWYQFPKNLEEPSAGTKCSLVSDTNWDYDSRFRKAMWRSHPGLFRHCHPNPQSWLELSRAKRYLPNPEQEEISEPRKQPCRWKRDYPR